MDIVVGGDYIGKVHTRRAASGVRKYTAIDRAGVRVGTYGTLKEAKDMVVEKMVVGDFGDGRIRTLTGTWELVHEDGRVLKVGDEVSVWAPGGQRRSAKILRLSPPHKESSTGRIDYAEDDGTGGSCYASVVDATYRCLDGASAIVGAPS